METMSRRGGIPAGIIALAVVVVSACGSTGGGNGAGGYGGNAAQSSSASAATTGIPVGVTEREFSIVLARSAFTAGPYTFTVVNHGQFAHNLTIDGPGVDKQASPTLSPGQSGDLTVTLQAGTYELWCSVDSHRDKGMDLKISVA